MKTGSPRRFAWLGPPTRHVTRWLGVGTSTTLLACASFGSRQPAGAPGAEGAGASAGYGTSGGVLPPSLAVPPPAAPEGHGPLLPEVVRARLSNGTELHVVSRPRSRLVSLRMVLRVPSRNAAERRIAVWAMESALRAPSQQKGEVDLDTFGSRPLVSASEDGLRITWSVLPPQLQPALDWLAARLRNPRLVDFEEVAWQLEKRELRRLRTDPSTLASYLDSNVLDAAGATKLQLQAPHPALRGPRAFECQRWLLGAVHPARVHLVIVGPHAAARAEAIAESTFGDWAAKKGSATADPTTTAAAPAPAPLHLADADGSAWAHLRLTFRGPDRSRGGRERAWVHLQWGLEILRGSASMERIARELRATSPEVTASTAGDTWLVHLDVAAPGEQALELATRMNDELIRIAEEGFSEPEVARAAQTLRARFRSSLQDQEQLATLLATLVEGDLDPKALLEELSPDLPAPHQNSTEKGQLGPAVERLRDGWQLARSVEELTPTVVGDAKRLEKALSRWRQVLVFDPKRDLRLLRRLDRDPSASPEISASATEETTPGP